MIDAKISQEKKLVK